MKLHSFSCIPLLAVCVLSSPYLCDLMGIEISPYNLSAIVANLMQVGSVIVPFYRVSSFAATPASIFGAVSSSMSVLNQLLVSLAS